MLNYIVLYFIKAWQTHKCNSHKLFYWPGAEVKRMRWWRAFQGSHLFTSTCCENKKDFAKPLMMGWGHRWGPSHMSEAGIKYIDATPVTSIKAKKETEHQTTFVQDVLVLCQYQNQDALIKKRKNRCMNVKWSFPSVQLKIVLVCFAKICHMTLFLLFWWQMADFK